MNIRQIRQLNTLRINVKVQLIQADKENLYFLVIKYTTPQGQTEAILEGARGNPRAMRFEGVKKFLQDELPDVKQVTVDFKK